MTETTTRAPTTRQRYLHCPTCGGHLHRVSLDLDDHGNPLAVECLGCGAKDQAR